MLLCYTVLLAPRWNDKKNTIGSFTAHLYVSPAQGLPPLQLWIYCGCADYTTDWACGFLVALVVVLLCEKSLWVIGTVNGY